MTTYTYVARNKLRSVLLIGLFIGFIALIGHIFGLVYGDSEGSILAAFIFACISSFVGYFFSDKIALAVNGAKPIQESDDPELYHLVENLAVTAGIPMPKLYMINDPSPNAFATGRNPQHSALAVTVGLRQMMNKSELEGVLAHEMSHIGNYDILFMTLVSVMVGTISMLADWFMRYGLWGRSSNDRENRNTNPIFLILGITLIVLSPIIATIIQLAVSRKREYLADASGALLTRYPEGLANALEKIKNNAQPLKRANSATAHMYISNPLNTNSLSKLFSTHPPLEERIKILREMNI